MKTIYPWLIVAVLTACNGAPLALVRRTASPTYDRTWDATPVATGQNATAVLLTSEATPTTPVAPAASLAASKPSGTGIGYYYPQLNPGLRTEPTAWGVLLGTCAPDGDINSSSGGSLSDSVKSMQPASPKPITWVSIAVALNADGVRPDVMHCISEQLKLASSLHLTVSLRLQAVTSDPHSQTSLAQLRQFVMHLIDLLRTYPDIQAVQLTRPTSMPISAYAATLSSVYGATKRLRPSVWVIADPGIADSQTLKASAVTIWGQFADCIGVTIQDIRWMTKTAIGLPNHSLCPTFSVSSNGQRFNMSSISKGVLLVWIHDPTLLTTFVTHAALT
ncbi:MAG: hypothetical protein HC853_00245 [Anaerolineae bacterium]|nr:hypothetical protein [Anaerolineae bacterium]